MKYTSDELQNDREIVMRLVLVLNQANFKMKLEIKNKIQFLFL